MTSRTFSRIPRVPLAHLPTPIVKVDPGWHCNALYVKRDDLTGCGLTGNKARKIEYLLADAAAAGADTLVTCGGVQSNCARALAVAAAMRGMRCILVLVGEAPAELDGNLLLDRFTGATILAYPTLGLLDCAGALEHAASLARREGGRPYVVPFGGSSEVGSLGYVRAALEIARQLSRCRLSPARIITPLASGGTFAGLFIGFQLAGLDLRPVGAFVLGSDDHWTGALRDLIERTAHRCRVNVRVHDEDIELLDASGAGYSQPTDAELEHSIQFARRTGLLLDPVYTGKAMFALDRAVAAGRFERQADVLFLHTGGVYGLFPHGRALARVLDNIDARRVAASA